MADKDLEKFGEGASEQDDIWTQAKKEEAQARRLKRAGDEKVGLAITSLLDIMTIMLVFLLVSVTSDPLNVKLGADMQLAGSTADVTPTSDSIPITVTKQNIVLDNKSVVNVRCQIDGDECTDEDWEKLNRCEEKPGQDVCAKDFKFFVDKQDKEKSDRDSLVIEPLRKELDRVVKQQMEEDEALGRKFKGVVTLIADKEIPFRLLMEVIYTAGKVGVKGKGGLSHFRFAIKKM